MIIWIVNGLNRLLCFYFVSYPVSSEFRMILEMHFICWTLQIKGGYKVQM